VQGDATLSLYQNPQAIFNNTGTVRKTGGTGKTTLQVTFNNNGIVEVQSGTLNLNNGLNQTAGETRLAGGSLSGGSLNFTGGTLSGSGIISASVVNGAIVSPGSSLGTLTINGSYAQSALGVLQMELGGATTNLFDRLVVNGTATLGGALNVTLLDGFTPAFGDAFSFMSYTSRNGSFSTINLPALPKPLALTAEYTPAALALLTVSSPDTKQTNTLSVIDTGSGSWELLVTGEPASTYRLQASTNLIDWLDLSTNAPSNGLLRFVDPDAMTLDRRFYRTVAP